MQLLLNTFLVFFFTQSFFKNVIKIFLIPFTDWVFQFKYWFALSNYFTLKISPITWNTQHLSCFICPHHHLHIFIKRSLYDFQNYVAQPLIPKTLHVHSPVSQLPASFSVTLLMFLEPHLASDTLLARCIFIIAYSSTGHHCSSLRVGKLQPAGQMQSTTCFCK